MMVSDLPEKKVVEDFFRFFHDPKLLSRFPDLKLPPPTFVASGARILSFTKGRGITLEFRVGPHQLNPMGNLQGGVLSFATMRRPSFSVDLHINFIRPFCQGETVRVEAGFQARSRTLLQLHGEAYNRKDKLGATATANMLVAGGDANPLKVKRT